MKQFNLINEKFIETVNINKLINCIKLSKQNNDTWSHTYLKKIQKKCLKGNSFKVEYSRKTSFGRIYPKISLGLVTKPYRQALLCDEWLDFDLANAQPTLLYEYCKKEGRDMPELQKYIVSRDDYLKEIIDHYSVSRDSAKQLIISFLNNGSLKNWKEQNKCSEKPDIPLTHFLKKEIYETINYIISENTDKFNEISKKCNEEEKQNIKGSFMSLFLGQLEVSVLQDMINYVKQNYANTENIILCHDGFNITKSLIGDNIKKFETDITNYLNEINKTSFIKVINKPMNEAISLEFKEELNGEEVALEILTPEEKELLDALTNYSHLSYAKDFYNLNKDEFIYYEKRWYSKNKHNVWIGETTDSIILKKALSSFNENQIKHFKQQVSLVQKKILVKALTQYTQTTGSMFHETGIINFLKQFFFNDEKNLFDSKSHLFSLNDKVIDLSDPCDIKFRNIDPKDYISTTTGYDFEEENEKQGNIIFKLLQQIFPDKQELTYTLNRIARCLFGKSPEKIYFEIGDGGNGKSVLFTSLLRATFGDYYTILNKSILTKPIMIGACPELMTLRNKRMIVISETSQKDILNTGVLNSITGGEPITTRGLYQESVMFEIVGALFILSNYKPKFDSPVQSNLTRRMQVTPYSARFTHNKDDVDESCYIYEANDEVKSEEFLKYNRVQILHLLLIHYEMSFKPPQSIINATNDYFKSSSGSFIEFFDENYSQIYNGPINDIKKKELVLKNTFVSIADVYEKFKGSEYYRNLDRDDKRNHTVKYCKDCLTKSLYTKYYIEKYQCRDLQSIVITRRNILVGFCSKNDDEDCIISSGPSNPTNLPEKDL